MFKCFACKKDQSPGTKQVKYATETRKKTYSNLIRRGRKEFSVNSEGWEIVSEVSVCNPCARAHTI